MTVRHPLVVIPTYNERDNLTEVVDRVRRCVPSAELLIVDDASPDGTGRLADEVALADDRVHVLHRPAKTGLGPAYVAGFRWMLASDYDAAVEMDADGSHAPEQLPELLAATADADVVLGSRWVPGGEIVDWPLRRQLLSRGGNTYARLALGLPLHDLTGGYRVYRRAVLDALDLDRITTRGYGFQVELALRAAEAGFRVVEVPIRFVERTAGTSKMSGAVVREALWVVTRWGLQRRRDRWRRRSRERS